MSRTNDTFARARRSPNTQTWKFVSRFCISARCDTCECTPVSPCALQPCFAAAHLKCRNPLRKLALQVGLFLAQKIVLLLALLELRRVLVRDLLHALLEINVLQRQSSYIAHNKLWDMHSDHKPACELHIPS